MKIKTIILGIFILGFSVISVQAQIKIPDASAVSNVPTEQLKVPDADFSKDILKALNPGDKLEISPDKLLKLGNKNKSFVNDILSTVGGSGSQSEIMEAIGVKKKERERRFY